MNIIKKTFILAAIGLAIAPYSCEAYVYDGAEVLRDVNTNGFQVESNIDPSMLKIDPALLEKDPDILNKITNAVKVQPNPEMLNKIDPEAKKIMEASKATHDDSIYATAKIQDNLTSAIDYSLGKYEDNKVKIVCRIDYMMKSLDGIANGSNNLVKVVNLRRNGHIEDQRAKEWGFKIHSIRLNFTNKTNEVMEVNLGKSFIGVNNFTIPVNNKMNSTFNKNIMVPKIVLPNDTMEAQLCTDELPINIKGKATAKYFLSTESELLGDYNLMVDNKEFKFALSAKIDSSKLKWKYDI